MPLAPIACGRFLSALSCGVLAGRPAFSETAMAVPAPAEAAGTETPPARPVATAGKVADAGCAAAVRLEVCCCGTGVGVGTGVATGAGVGVAPTGGGPGLVPPPPPRLRRKPAGRTGRSKRPERRRGARGSWTHLRQLACRDVEDHIPAETFQPLSLGWVNRPWSVFRTSCGRPWPKPGCRRPSSRSGRG